MTIFSVLSTLLIIASIVLLLNLTPEHITDDFLHIFSPKQSLRDRVNIAQGKKKSRKLSAELMHIREALTETGKSGQFTMLCALSPVLLTAGGLIAVLLNNLFLVPILSVALAMIPFLYAKSTIAYYDRHIEKELETALSIITTSYVRSDDIVAAFSENIGYINPPVRDILKAFIGEATAVRSDLKAAIMNLKEKINNEIFCEWCDTLIACQDDRTLKNTLLPIVNKLTDVRIVNNELKTMLYEPRKEYFTMAALVIGNVPLLYLLNGDWYRTLMDTLPGKIVLAVTGAAILITAMLMMKYTKPIEYKR